MLQRFLPSVVLAFSLGFCGFSWAQTEEKQPVRIVITKTDCSRLVRHTPDAGVAYVPGEGRNGRQVAPADLPGSGAASMPQLLPDVLEIPLTVKPMLGKAYATHGLDDSSMSLGTVKYDMAKNSFTLNGAPLGDAEQQQLSAACTKRMKGIR